MRLATRGPRRAASLLAASLASLAAASLLGCGSTPPPPVEAPQKEETRPERSGPAPQMSQELGSIDQRKVEQTFANLVSGPLEACHSQGRARVEVLTGDVKVFLRIDGNGRMRYGYFEETTLGDRDTEKCILGVFSSATWPKPEGGEAEVRSGFGWDPGGERAPTSWASDKVTVALVESKDIKRHVDTCKAGVKGDFHITAYVEEGESEAADHAAKHGKSDKPKNGKPAAKHPAGKKAHKESGGRFLALGVSAPSKEGAEKIDCIVDALKPLELPSPGSYPAKVTFSL